MHKSQENCVYRTYILTFVLLILYSFLFVGFGGVELFWFVIYFWFGFVYNSFFLIF